MVGNASQPADSKRFDVEDIRTELEEFGDTYGKLGFALSLVNTVLLLVILFFK